MTLYRWYSAYLKDYGLGNIIVMAEDVDAARAIALAQFDAYDRERYGFCTLPDEPYDDSEDIAERRAIFEEDVASEPEIMPGFLFIKGSA